MRGKAWTFIVNLCFLFLSFSFGRKESVCVLCIWEMESVEKGFSLFYVLAGEGRLEGNTIFMPPYYLLGIKDILFFSVDEADSNDILVLSIFNLKAFGCM